MSGLCVRPDVLDAFANSPEDATYILRYVCYESVAGGYRGRLAHRIPAVP
jgi:hypothetical protein